MVSSAVLGDMAGGGGVERGCARVFLGRVFARGVAVRVYE